MYQYIRYNRSISANDRDAIQDLKEAALNKEFNVLLVYMFDRLDRRDDETPFVVEWFAKQGIEVWSTQEGQQQFENHTDKLLNYIRYWQVNGESVKTSMRLKTRMAQLTADGIYHGGATPLGYKAVNLGRVNKKGQSVKDLQIEPGEAEYVKMIFNKTLNEGYGSYRMAEYLNKLGVRTHNGSEFQCNTINRILKNKLYCGYYVADKKIAECDRALEEKGNVISKLDYYYEQFITWANEFDKTTQEQRKMIICQLIDEINVGRGYNIEIKMNASYGQFFSDAEPIRATEDIK
ncbi:MAG: recombinase family protein [Clostridiales bacterium]|nr:recombinase family protein [Clostridiales bacterium]